MSGSLTPIPTSLNGAVSTKRSLEESSDEGTPLKVPKVDDGEDAVEADTAQEGLSVGFPELNTDPTEDANGDNEHRENRESEEVDHEERSISVSAEADSDSDSDSDGDSDSDSSLEEIELDSTVPAVIINDPALKDAHVPPSTQDIASETLDLNSIQSIDLKETPMTEQLRQDARTYLKTEGHAKFLAKFIPEVFTPEDILLVTKLLGYVPKDFEKYFKEQDTKGNLEKCIVLLQKAINKVFRMRQKLKDYSSIEQICRKIEEAQNIIVLTGAGISTSLGIPDFRSSQGFYSKMKNLGLDDPQDVFSLEVFRDDPIVFYSIAHMILPPEHSFTPLHGFIKLLQDKGKLLRNYTQNIDNLESNAGVAPDKMIRCHGSFATASCITCKFQVPGEVLYPNLREKEIAYCPFCAEDRAQLIKKYEEAEDNGNAYSRRFEDIKSFGVMKPDITFFGEDLPQRYHNTIREDLKKCDLLLCIGTSLKVAPVSEIVNMISETVPQVLINRDLIQHAEFDAEFLGYCDQVIVYLCGKLNWEIDHKDFQKILHSGLEVEEINSYNGTYAITDADERRKKAEAEAEAEAAAKDKEDEAANSAVANQSGNVEQANDVDIGTTINDATTSV